MAKYVRKLIDDYCVIDLETTGLSFEYSEIIEIGVVKVIDGKIVEKFSTLIKPKYEVDEYITELTGITNDMLIDAPKFDEIKNEFENFINGFVIVGHNTKFDIGFLEMSLSKKLECEYIDTLQFSRKLFPDLKHHRLKDMVDLLNLSNNNHRAIKDCISTYELYELIKKKMKDENIKVSDIFKIQKYENFGKTLVADTSLFDEENMLFNKHCCFTGTLNEMTRREASQIVLNIGGKVDNNITKKTNYLIMGNFDYIKTIKEGASTKVLKARQLKKEGNDIEIIDENTFYKILDIKTNNKKIVKHKNNNSNTLTVDTNMANEITEYNRLIRFFDALNKLDENLSKYSIFKSQTGKWFSFKTNNKTIIKITYPTKDKKYIFELDGNTIEIDDVEKFLNLNKEKIYNLYKKLSTTSTDDMFGCCSYYIECSDALKCVKDDSFSKNCYYRRNLENGRIFYGKNKNIK